MSLLLFFATPAPVDYEISTSGTIVSSGGISRDIGKAEASDLPVSGIIVNNILKTYDGGIVSIGNVNKVTAKDFSGSLPTSGSLTANIAYALVLAGQVGLAGSIEKIIVKAFSGQAVGTGEAQKNAETRYSGNVSPTGGSAKGVLKDYGGATAPTGTASKAAGKVVSGDISPSGSFSKTLSKLLSLTGQIAPTGNTAKGFAKSLSGQIVGSGGILVSYVRNIEIGSILMSAGRIISAAFEFTTDSDAFDISPVNLIVMTVEPVNDETMTIV